MTGKRVLLIGLSGVLLTAGLASVNGEAALSSKSASQNLTVVVAAEPPTLDGLHESSTAVFSLITQNIEETLTRTNTRTRQVLPILAASWKQLSPHRWNIGIRKGVKFQNGKPMTVNDVLASFNYVLAKDSAFASYFPAGSAVRRLNASTIQFTSPTPDALLPQQLQFVSVAPAANISKGETYMASNPLGTGPYMLVAWNRGTSINLTRFAGYWGKAPAIKNVKYVWNTQSSVRADMVRTGEAQLADALTANDVKGLPKLVAAAGTTTYVLFLNSIGQTQPSIMQNQKVRLAVAYAIDHKALQDQIYGGYASLTHGNVVPPVVRGNNPKLTDYPYNPSMAKSLLSQAGDAGKSISFVCTNQTFINVAEACQLIAAELSQVGFRVSLSTPPFADWLTEYRNGPAGKDRPDILWGTPGDETLDMSGKVARTYFLPWQAGGGGATINDPTLTALVGQAASQSDTAKREKLEQQMSKIVHDNAYIIPLVVPSQLYGVSKNVSFAPAPTHNLLLSTIRYTG